MNVREVLLAIWPTVLIAALCVPILASCISRPDLKGKIEIEFADINEEDPLEPGPGSE